MFLSTLLRVATMLAYAIPGFLFIRTKAFGPEAIPAFAKLLLYVCSPSLVLYSFSRARYTPQINLTLLICFLTAFTMILVFLLVFRFLLRRKYESVCWRVFTICTALGNVGFFGIPLLEHFLSEYPNVFLVSEIMSVSMNLLAWTLGMFILSGDKSFMRPLKVVTVPSFLAMLVAYPLFVLEISLPAPIVEMVTLLGKMSTPVCMLILGMRLATTSWRVLLSDRSAWLVSAVKLLLFPAAMAGVMLLLPVEPYIRTAMFLLAACPCASVALSLCEINGRGQKNAANAVLISTLLCVITLPILSELTVPLLMNQPF